MFTKQKQQCKCCTRQELYKLSAQRHIFVQHLHDDSCCCFAAELVVQESVLKYSIKKGFTYKDDNKEVEEERKRNLRKEMRGFITHFTDR
jgi:hypothetical protein